MPRYPYLLFDADDTLFSFPAANRAAFAAACAVSGLTFSEALLSQYEAHNSALWRQFDRGELGSILRGLRGIFSGDQHEADGIFREDALDRGSAGHHHGVDVPIPHGAGDLLHECASAIDENDRFGGLSHDFSLQKERVD